MKKPVCLLLLAGLVFSQTIFANDESSFNQVAYGESDFNRDFMSIKSEIDDLKLIVSQLIMSVKEKKSELVTLSSVINEKKTELVVLEEAVARAKDDLTNARGELDKIMVTRADAEKTLASLKSETVVSAQAAVPVSKPVSEVVPPKKASEPAVDFVRAPEDSDGNVLTTVYFDPDSTNLVPYYIPRLKDISNQMKNNPNLKITVKGYSAPSGTQFGQLKVSEERAKACASYLVSQGIPSDRVVIEWVGASQKHKKAVEGTVACLRAAEIIVKDDDYV